MYLLLILYFAEFLSDWQYAKYKISSWKHIDWQKSEVDMDRIDDMLNIIEYYKNYIIFILFSIQLYYNLFYCKDFDFFNNYLYVDSNQPSFNYIYYPVFCSIKSLVFIQVKSGYFQCFAKLLLSPGFFQKLNWTSVE